MKGVPYAIRRVIWIFISTVPPRRFGRTSQTVRWGGLRQLVDSPSHWPRVHDSRSCGVFCLLAPLHRTRYRMSTFLMVEQSNTQTRSETRRMAILEAAQKCFFQYGLERTRMDDIARVAQISRPALYEHFDNKSAIFL